MIFSVHFHFHSAQAILENHRTKVVTIVKHYSIDSYSVNSGQQKVTSRSIARGSWYHANVTKKVGH